jgi:CCR4-NOT transcription complex subunit 1
MKKSIIIVLFNLLVNILFGLKAIQSQGFEADRHLLRCLLSHIDLKEIEGPRNISHKDYYQVQLLAQQCTTLLNKPSLTSILCFALDNPLHLQKVTVLY